MAIIATLPAVLAGASTARIAVGVGAALMAARAVGALSTGVLALAGARVLYRSARPILEAARRASSTGAAASASLPSPEASPPKTQALLEVRDLVFKHAGAPRAVLDGRLAGRTRG